ncbi:AtpZ/AtpI family protein [Haliangium sp.]|uniref:AtpZ/AtpI family protein n=1 Tax=Haliangium sp. TaxID=2663208 RepID=UPI003D0F1508
MIDALPRACYSAADRCPGVPLIVHSSQPSAPRIKKAYDALSVSALGLEMGLAVLVGWGIGRWLDGTLGTAPYLTYVFLLCGVGAAFKAIWRVGMQAKRIAGESQQGERGGGRVRQGHDRREPR